MEAQHTPGDTLRELMARWDEYRDKWIAQYGSDEGFAGWFTEQTTKAEGGTNETGD